MKRSGLFLACLLISWIPSFCQVSNDTIRCYTRSQLLKIATKLEKKKECDTLLFLSEIKILNQDTIITNNSLQISNYKTISIQKETIIQGKDTEIKDLRAVIQRSQKREKWEKILWISTSTLLITLLILK